MPETPYKKAHKPVFGFSLDTRRQIPVKITSVPRRGLIGNLVKIGSGPAAVIRDESRNHATVCINGDGKARQLG
jgi:hypothetical protein